MTPRTAVGVHTLRRFRALADRVDGLSSPSRYLIAVLAAVGGLVLRLALDSVWQARLPYITLFPAVMLGAGLGGLGPGLAATLLAALGAAYLWIPPAGSLLVTDPGDLLGLAVFLSVGVVISLVSEAWRRGTVALAGSEQLLSVTLGSIGDAVLTTDEDGNVLTMNEVAERLTGWTSAEAKGRRIEDVMELMEETSPSVVPNPVRQAVRDGKTTGPNRHATLVKADGGRVSIDYGAAPIRLADRTVGAVLVLRDITERRRLETEQETQDRTARELASIVENSDDAIVSKDLHSIIRSWNQGAERMFGYSAEEMIGRSIRTIIPTDRWSEEDDVLRQLRDGHRVDHFETIRRRKDGTEVPVSLTISPIRSASGVVVGASKVARDITDRRQAEAERAQLLEREQQARAEIERAGRLKDDFLAVLSHELRTPLNAVLGYTHLLLSGALRGDEVVHAYQAIQRNAQTQARLVESLLDTSRVLAGKLELNTEVLDVSSTIAQAVDALRPEALKAQVSLEVVDVPGTRVFGDAVRLQQVFWNLLSNAIKFTPAGGRVTVHVEPADEDVVVRVADNGRGIPAALLPFVFDRFRQGEQDRSRVQSGLGLGLALVREMVQAHKGTVTAESPGEGHGSTFTVRLPLFLSRTAVLTPTQSQDREIDLDQWRPDVLVVDDEPDARDMLALLLETRGANVRSVGSAREAFEAMSEQPPQILLADLGMPIEDGYSLIRRWRLEEEKRQQSPIAAIAVTAYASAADRDRAMAAGYNNHIAKPVQGDDLVKMIISLLAAAHTQARGLRLAR